MNYASLAAAAALVWATCAWAGPAPPPLEAYGNLPATEEMRLSPDGDRIAFIGTSGEHRRAYATTADGAVLTVADLMTTKVRSLSWADEDHLLVLVSKTMDVEHGANVPFEGVLAMPINVVTKKVGLVFSQTREIGPTTFGYFGSRKRNGHLYGYFGGLTFDKNIHGEMYPAHNWRDLYRVDLDTLENSLVAHGSDDVADWVLGPDGAVIARAEYDGPSGSWRLYAAGGGLAPKPLITLKSPLDELGLLGMGRTADTVVVADSSSGDTVWKETPLDGRPAVPLFESRPANGLVYDGVSGRLLGATLTNGAVGEFFDPAQQARLDAVRRALGKRRVSLMDQTADLQKMIVYTDGSEDSGSYWLVDLPAKRVKQIGSARPDIPPEAVGPTSLIRYKAGDGLEIEAVLTLPPGSPAKNLPVVVMPHGGPIGVRDDPGFDWWAQAFASRGYAVLQPNYRGSDGYGGDFLKAGYGQWGRKMQSDVSDGLAYLAAQGVVDPKRACIVGASYGGYAALAGVTLQHGLYRCAVSVSGVADLNVFFAWQLERHEVRSDTTRYWRAVTGVDKEGMGVLKSISPAAFAAQADAPVLLIHGKDDTVVPFAQSRQMLDALKRAGKPVELVTLAGEDHWLSRQATRTAMLKAAVDFVQKHNPAD